MGNNVNTIHVGGNVGGNINQNNNGNFQYHSDSLPKGIDKKQLQEFMEFMKTFISSESADELSRKELRKTEKIIEEAEVVESKLGWQKIRDYLSETADATTLISAMAVFTTTQGHQITEWIRNLPLFQ